MLSLSDIKEKVETLYERANVPLHYRPKVNDTPFDDDWTLVCAEGKYQLIMRQKNQNRIFTSSEDLDKCLFVMFKHIIGVVALEYAEENPSETELRWEIRCRILQETLTKLDPEWGILLGRTTEVFIGEHPLDQDTRERDERND